MIYQRRNIIYIRGLRQQKKKKTFVTSPKHRVDTLASKIQTI